ncbi:hypothetical protein [Humibacillus xanthopallidus]|uniref:Uncharacterized protein n=1 Tax=Humibacillus xanthopallidus TaxID=412689 RepID=A0A543HWA5_9MICO|nr:hypothetical protein [Humibacillus xanthopallidus]TQM62590.1 hypothetical protein FBY41_2626 [Humibacillus xanthopallidus]
MPDDSHLSITERTLRSIAAKQAAHSVPVDSQGRPTEPAKARRYDTRGQLEPDTDSATTERN